MRVHDVKDKLLRAYAMNIADVMLKFVEVDDLLEDLWRKRDPVVDELVNCLRRVCLRFDNPRYQRLTFRIGVYALWVMVMDEAYNEFLFSLLWEVLSSFRRYEIEDRVVDPESWRVNRIWRAKGEGKS